MLLFKINNGFFKFISEYYGQAVLSVLERWAYWQIRIRPSLDNMFYVPLGFLYNIFVFSHKVLALVLYVPYWILDGLILSKEVANTDTDQRLMALFNNTRSRLEYRPLMGFDFVDGFISGIDGMLNNVFGLVAWSLARLGLFIDSTLFWLDLNQPLSWWHVMVWPLIWIKQLAKRISSIDGFDDEMDYLAQFNVFKIFGNVSVNKNPGYYYSDFALDQVVSGFFIAFLASVCVLGMGILMIPRFFLTLARKGLVYLASANSKADSGILNTISAIAINLMVYVFNVINGIIYIPFYVLMQFNADFWTSSWPHRLGYVSVFKSNSNPALNQWLDALVQVLGLCITGLTEILIFILDAVTKPWVENQNVVIKGIGSFILFPLVFLQKGFNAIIQTVRPECHEGYYDLNDFDQFNHDEYCCDFVDNCSQPPFISSNTTPLPAIGRGASLNPLNIFLTQTNDCNGDSSGDYDCNGYGFGDDNVYGI